MKFTKISDIEYTSEDHSYIDIKATCTEYGEIPMTLNLVDKEDIHTFVKEDGTEVPLEEYCLQQINQGNYSEYNTEKGELQQQSLKRIEANTYLSQTDWVETYYIKHLLKIETIENNSSKWDIINKREEYKALLKTLNS